jgi:hypothetical protein
VSAFSGRDLRLRDPEGQRQTGALKRTDLSRRLLADLDIAGLFDAIVGAGVVWAIKPYAAYLIGTAAVVGGDLARTPAPREPLERR